MQFLIFFGVAQYDVVARYGSGLWLCVLAGVVTRSYVALHCGKRVERGILREQYPLISRNVQSVFMTSLGDRKNAFYLAWHVLQGWYLAFAGCF